MQTTEDSLLFEKNSTFYVGVPEIFEKMTGIDPYALDSYVEGGKRYVVLKNEYKLNHSMASFLFVKSPDIEGNGYVLDCHNVTNIDSESLSDGLDFRFISSHDNKLIRISEMVLYVKCVSEEENSSATLDMDRDIADIKNKNSDDQIKYLEKHGYKKFRVIGTEINNSQSRSVKIIDEENNLVTTGCAENRCVARNDLKDFISLGHINEIDGDMNYSYKTSNWNCIAKKWESVIGSSTLYETSSFRNIVILGKDTKFKFDSKKRSPFSHLKGPLKFYVRPDSKALEDILRMYQDPKNNPEFKDATVVFIGPEIANSYSKIVDDMNSDVPIEKHIKDKGYEQDKDYLEVKLSQLKGKKGIDAVLDSVKQFAKKFENADNSAKFDGSIECETESKACAENLGIFARIFAFIAQLFHRKSKQETKNIDTENKNKNIKNNESNIPAQESLILDKNTKIQI